MSLTLFLPGAFAGMPDALRRLYGAVAPDVELAFHPFVPSGDLAREILDGSYADVYVSANQRFMDDLHAAGLVEQSYLLARNRLCIIARPDVAPPLSTLTDVLRPDLRVVIPQSATDPCGQYLVDLFKQEGLSEELAEKQALGELVYSHGSGDLPAFLFDGRADVGMFYASEAQTLGERVVTTMLPADQDFRDWITFVVGVVAGRTCQQRAAADFVAWMLGPQAQALLAAHGFLATEG